MTMKALTTLAALSLFSLAAHAEDAAVSNTASKLDIARVINQTPDASACGIHTATLVYQDSKGERHTLTYLTQGSGCADS
jgi:hypothetical protein